MYLTEALSRSQNGRAGRIIECPDVSIYESVSFIAYAHEIKYNARGNIVSRNPGPIVESWAKPRDPNVFARKGHTHEFVDLDMAMTWTDWYPHWPKSGIQIGGRKNTGVILKHLKQRSQ